MSKSLISKLDYLIQFKELSKAEIKRRKGEKGSSRSRTADAAALGVLGAGAGGIAGATSTVIKSGGKWKIDPFKGFRPGASESRGTVDYGNTLGGMFKTPGDEWKDPAYRSHPSEAFQKGIAGGEELAARRDLQKRFRSFKRITKRGLIGAGIGATALALPAILKKPYPAGSGRESAGIKKGASTGSILGAYGGLAVGAAHMYHRNSGPGPLLAGLLGGSVVGNMIGKRAGGAIGSRTKRKKGRGEHVDAKQLSSKLNDIINFSLLEKHGAGIEKALLEIAKRNRSRGASQVLKRRFIPRQWDDIGKVKYVKNGLAAKLDGIINFADMRPRNPQGEFTGSDTGVPNPNVMAKTYGQNLAGGAVAGVGAGTTGFAVKSLLDKIKRARKNL